MVNSSKRFLVQHPNLVLVNSLDICKGTITRRRQTVKQLEDSVLDFFLVCTKVNHFLISMKIDDEKAHILTSYRKTKNKTYTKESDHFTSWIDLKLKVVKKKPPRVQLYNFHNKDN